MVFTTECTMAFYAQFFILLEREGLSLSFLLYTTFAIRPSILDWHLWMIARPMWVYDFLPINHCSFLALIST